MAKRRLISQLPAFNQTDDLQNFFGSTVDQVFQPGTSEPLSGYIGRRPGSVDPLDFYIGEPTASRAAYQLESGMVSYDSTGTLTEVLSYPDFVGYLQTNGADVSDHQRLFETEYYSWSPPINLDMLVNYRHYYWFGDLSGESDLRPLVLTVPMTLETGNGVKTIFDLPASILAVPANEEAPAVYVDNLPVTFSIVGTTVVLNTPPPFGSDVLVARVPDLISALIGKISVPVSDINPNGVSYLSSGMRINVIDALHIIGAWDAQPWDYAGWDFGGENIYMVDGIGLSVRFSPDDQLIRGIEAQYVTIDRSSRDGNSWSLRNLWVHRDTFAWAIVNNEIQAAQVIGSISGHTLTVTTVNFGFLGIGQPITGSDIAPGTVITAFETGNGGTGTYLVNVPQTVSSTTITATNAVPLANRQAKRPIIEFLRDLLLWQDSATLASSAVLGSTTLTLTRALPDLSGRLVSGAGIATGTLVQSIQGNTITLSKPTNDVLAANATINFSQLWAESIDPLFQLFDLNHIVLSDPTQYPGSNFTGSRIFGYKDAVVGSVIDPVLHRALVFDNNDYIVFANESTSKKVQQAAVVDRYTYTGGAITGLFTYAARDITTVYESLWHASHLSSTQGMTNGFFNVPRNLEANPNSEEVGDISRSTWTGQFGSIIGNQPALTGQPLGDNNFRDTARDLTLGTSILQHRAPLLKAMLLASDSRFDLPLAIRYVDQEYNRFRNKFARKLIDLHNRGVLLDSDVPNTWVTTALNAIKRGKTNQFPFALNMLGGGQYFIPPTPTCLGVLPSAVPAMVTDSTYATPVNMILGHDGSFTPAFNDWRDPIMLALEQAIYASLPNQFKTEARPGFDIQQWIGGRFFEPLNGYTSDEVNNMLAPMFEAWAQQNHFDYRLNSHYDAGNPFTWNFRDVLSRDGKPLPGNWRAIYRFYYGTDAPHLRPWEMLGFLYEPSWWQTSYGAAPYTRSNTALWTDLENGTIIGGPRAGTDHDYARPGLSQILPVDSAGNLFDPVAIGIVTTTVSPDSASRSWFAGDGAPVETLWRNTPAYRFALAQISFLMKPVRLVEECWDKLNIGYVGDQWVELATLERPLNAKQDVFGEIRNATPVLITGISQWIADYLLSAGSGSEVFGTAVRGLDVRLIHQMAGFTSLDDMKVVADSFGLLPADDVKVVRYTSPSTRVEVYSGVILEWTGRSWRVIGYDARNPFFSVIPPDTNGPKGLISISDVAEPSIVEWRPNVYFPAAILVEYLNTVWQCQRGHTSGPQFEQIFWNSRPDLNTAMIRAPRVVSYLRGLDTTQIVPYGAEFFTYQQVADFLLGWQRWLVSRGWIFDTTDDSGVILNWSLSVKEFLSWAQVQWSPGNFIALSPGQQQLKFSTDNGTILNIENPNNAFFGLSDRSGRPIGPRDAIISRMDGDLTIHAKDADIFAARLGFADIEHAFVVSNVTIFDDRLYLPLFDLRVLRLRLICKRSRDWAGRLDAPGFMVIGSQLHSDFEKAVEDVRLMFDIEFSDRVDLRDYARHVIGFQTRDYLENLLLSDVEQFEFYQGMIHAKGAPSVFHKLVRSNRASNATNLQFLEEWAIRIGEFGAPLDPFMIFRLGQTDTRDDPQLVRMVPTIGAPSDWIVLSATDSRWLDQPPNPALFNLRTDYVPGVLPNAGPLRLTDVSNFVFHLSEVPDLYLSLQQTGVTPFPTGSSTWIYERGDGTYTVLRSFETGSTPNPILTVVTHAEDVSVTTTKIIFQNPISLTTADVGNFLVVDGPSLSVPDLQGVATIAAVHTGTNSVDLVSIGTTGSDFTARLDKAPFVRVLREVRFPTTAELLASGDVFAVNDLVWIDNYQASGRWAVLQWSGTAWIAVRNQPRRADPSTISETVIYRAGTRLVDQQMIIDEPVVDEVTVIDPLSGLIAGIARREIDFTTDYDPARYNAGSNSAANPWGAPQVGRVWWNLATVKFLDPNTDTLAISTARDLAELSYRTANWSHIAPNTSVDVYEWVESTVDPSRYSGPGTVLNSDNPSWAEHTQFDAKFGRFMTLYYFWAKDLTVTPNLSFRHTDVSTVALAIENPSGLDLAWMAPIAQDAMLVSGVSQFLDDTTTAMKVRLTLNPESASRHDQWQLMRPTDETSLPPPQIWDKLRDSLGGFDTSLRPIPSPALSVLRATGIRQSQSMFATNGPGGVRSGLRAARQSFVGIINTIFTREPFTRDRFALLSTLSRSTPIDPHLIWTQPDASYVYDPPPKNEWDVRVFSLGQRNRLLPRSDFIAALTSGKKIRVLIDGFANPLKQWSIWEFNPTAANTLIAANPSVPVGELLMANADTVFSLTPSYEIMVNDMITRNAAISGTPLAEGDRVLVTNSTDFWSVWKYLPSDPNADSFGFVLWRVQTYRSGDFVEQIDWFMSGYSASNPPIVTYATITDRNITEGPIPTNQFVKINNDGTGHWIWTQFDGQWTTVALQSGTLALSSDLYADRPIHGLDLWQNTTQAASAGDVTLRLIDTSGIGIGQFVQGSAFDRMTRVTAVLPTSVTFDTPILTDLASNAPVAFTTLSLSDVATRDGSWELAVLAETLRYGGLLTDIEINEVFFSLLNFIHVQQDSVDWAFKTSFITIIGYNVPLQQSPVVVSDQTASLVSYITEVKPYHCKLRSFSAQYNTEIDKAMVTIGEDQTFDLTLLFDRYTFEAWDVLPWDSFPWDIGDPSGFIYVQTVVRVTLDADSQSIDVDNIRFLKNVYPNDVLTPVSATARLTIEINGNEYQIADVEADLVNISSTSHGVSGRLTTASGHILVADGIAGTVVEAKIAMPDAATRIIDYYQPTTGMPANDLISLLDLEIRPSFVSYTVIADVVAGATVIALNSTTDVVVGQPVFGPNIERGTLVTIVTPSAITLSQPVIDKIFAATTVTIAMPNAISGTDLADLAPDFTYDGGIDPLGSVELSINPALAGRPDGFALRDPYANRQPEERVPVSPDDALHLLVTTLPDAGGPPQIIRAFDVSGVISPTVTLFFDLVAQSANAVLVWRDGVRAILNTDYTVDHFARTVTVNLSGMQRVAIHAFGFGGISAVTDVSYLAYASNPVTLEDTTSTADVIVVVAGNRLASGYTVSGNQLTLTSPPSVGSDVAVAIFASGASTATQISVQSFVWNAPQNWTLNPFDTDTVIAGDGTVVEVDGLRLSPSDYTVVGSLLHISAALDPSAKIVATLFTNAASMAIETVSYPVNPDPTTLYSISIPSDKNSAMVWMNGLRLVPDLDYRILPDSISTSKLQIFTPTSGDVVATVCTGLAATGMIQWMENSRLPSVQRMPPALDTDGLQIIATPTHGTATPAGAYELRDEYVNVSPFMAGSLASPLGPDDVTIMIDLFLRPLSPKLLPDEPLTIPDRTPGAIWIGSERIEYFGYSRSGDVVTLSQLQRGTHGTSIAEQRQVMTGSGVEVPQSFLLSGTGVVEVLVDDASYPFSATVAGGNTSVGLTADFGTFIVVAMTTGYSYAIGSVVYNGDTPFASVVAA